MPKIDPVLQDGRDSLSIYLYLVHDTDMPEVHGGKAMPAAHHTKMIDVLVQDKYGHSLILAPRGAAKTKLLQALIEWRLGRASLGLDGFGRNWAKDFRVGYVCASASQAYGVSNAIKETVEFNPVYRAMFPKVKPHKKKWSEPEWNVQGQTTKDYTFVAAGRGGPILGKRFHMIVPDDIAGEDERSSDLLTATKPRRDLIFWIENTMLKCLVPGGRIIMAATRWYEDDPPQWAMEQGWDVLKIQALTDCDGSCDTEVAIVTRPEQDSEGASKGRAGASLYQEKGGEADDILVRRNSDVLPDLRTTAPGRNDVRVGEGGTTSCPGEHSFWPQRFSAIKLIADRKKNPRSFALQMQNEIIPSQGLYFYKEWFDNRYDSLPGPEQLRAVVATWDTAGTTTGRSYTAGLVIYVTKDWNYYIRALYRKKMPYHEVKELIIFVAGYWKVSLTLIEDKATGQSALQELAYRKTVDGEGIYGAIEGALPAGQRGGPAKDLEYIEQITLPCSEGRVWLPSNEFIKKYKMDDWRDVFLAELIRFGEPGGTDDTVMALKQLLYRAERQRYKFEVLARGRAVPALTYGRSREEGMLV